MMMRCWRAFSVGSALENEAGQIDRTWSQYCSQRYRYCDTEAAPTLVYDEHVGSRM